MHTTLLTQQACTHLRGLPICKHRRLGSAGKSRAIPFVEPKLPRLHAKTCCLKDRERKLSGNRVACLLSCLLADTLGAKCRNHSHKSSSYPCLFTGVWRDSAHQQAQPTTRSSYSFGGRCLAFVEVLVRGKNPAGMQSIRGGITGQVQLTRLHVGWDWVGATSRHQRVAAFLRAQ